MSKNYYDILGVNKNATQDEIKKAFRDLSKKYHPDRKDGNEEKFKEVNEAYSVLGDEKKRREYDSPNVGGGFSSFWHNGFDGFRKSYSNVRVNVNISINEAYFGCKKNISINGKVLAVDIPKGVVTGQKLNISGYGNYGYDYISGTYKNGDLIVIVMVVQSPNDSFYLNNDGSLETIQPIDWIDAILGGEKTIEVFDRKVTFRIPKYTQNGGYTIVSNSGYRKLKSDELGILKVNFIVKMPRKLTDSQIKLLEKIKESN